MKMEAEEVTVIVHGAKGLRGKKPGRHKFSVIFGCGSKKYRTAVVKNPGGNPDWNEESAIDVKSAEHIFFTITEKDDILGQVLVPISSLDGTRGKVVRVALQPHKKCAKPQGDLIYQCYVSKHQLKNRDTLNGFNSCPRTSSLSAVCQTLVTSPIFSSRLNKKNKRSSALSNFNKKLSRSFHDLFHLNRQSEEEKSDEESEPGLWLKSKSIGNLNQVGVMPKITNVTASNGLVPELTRLTIDGENLGLCKSDIVALSVFGCDCLDTVEFESSMRLHCSTHICGQGNIVIETESGGELRFPVNLSRPITVVEEIGEPVSSPSKGPLQPFLKSKDQAKEMQTHQETELPEGRSQNRFLKHMRHTSDSKLPSGTMKQTEFTIYELSSKVSQLQEENKALQQENCAMKAYIDRLVAKVLVNCPEALSADDDLYISKI